MTGNRKLFILLGTVVCLGLGIKYLLPVLLPFLLGAALALAAEPAVRFGRTRLRLGRVAAAGLGVTATLLLLATVALFLGAVLMKELGSLASVVPDLEHTAQNGLLQLQDLFIRAANHAPEGVRPVLTKVVLDTFDGSTELMPKLTGRLPGLVTSALGKLPDGALGIGTALLSAFMISARLPLLKPVLEKRLPETWRENWHRTWQQVRRAVGGWVKAQLKLSAVTWCIVALGLTVLGVPYGALWAVVIAVVDAVPVLGTGTVLLPWALICVVQQAYLRGAGLAIVYAVALLARTVLEPRLVGKHLGIDPLVTLLALYAGYRLWGIPGMILAPLLATTIKALTDTLPGKEQGGQKR